jgi:hypothetical protein
VSRSITAQIEEHSQGEGYPALHQLIYSVGWELGERERTAIAQVPEQAWQIAIDHHGEVRERRAEDACADRGCAHRRCWSRKPASPS